MQIILSLLLFFKSLSIYFQKITIHDSKFKLIFCFKIKENMCYKMKNDIKFVFNLKKTLKSTHQ
jgi:hypothetical protein